MIELRLGQDNWMKEENIFLNHSLIKCVSLLEFDHNTIF